MKIRIPKAAWVSEWSEKEFGSWDDSGNDPNHPCAILRQQGKTVDITKGQAEKLINSGRYHSTA